MDFGLSEDQLLLEKTVRGFLADQVPIQKVRELRDKDCPNDRAIWQSLAELGIAGVLVPEEQGGSGLADSCPASRPLNRRDRGRGRIALTAVVR